MSITVEDVLELEAWIERGVDEKQREECLERVQERLFPKGISEGETKRREAIVETAKQRRVEEEEEKDPMPPLPLTPEALRPSQHPRWDGLISRDSPAYRRGSRHDGTLDEVERMREVAQGSPFDAERGFVPEKPVRPLRK